MKEMMATTKNIPDRFKLILQFVVFSLGGALLCLLILMFSGFFAHFQNTKFSAIIIILPVAISVALNSWRFIIQWKRVKNQEQAGKIPDYQNKQNITPTQLIPVCVFIILQLGVFVVDQLYWEGAWKIFTIICIVAAVWEWLFLKKIRTKDSQVE